MMINEMDRKNLEKGKYPFERTVLIFYKRGMFSKSLKKSWTEWVDENGAKYSIEIAGNFFQRKAFKDFKANKPACLVYNHQKNHSVKQNDIPNYLKREDIVEIFQDVTVA